VLVPSIAGFFGSEVGALIADADTAYSCSRATNAFLSLSLTRTSPLYLYV
jgi:hypothetical protein